MLTATSTTMTDLLAQPGPATDAAYAPLRALVARRDALLRGLVAARRREVRVTVRVLTLTLTLTRTLTLTLALNPEP